jgi:hypothetical protein
VIADNNNTTNQGVMDEDIDDQKTKDGQTTCLVRKSKWLTSHTLKIVKSCEGQIIRYVAM